MGRDKLRVPERMFDYYTPTYRYTDFLKYKGRTYSVRDIVDDCLGAMKRIDLEALFVESPMLMKAVIEYGLQHPDEADWKTVKAGLSDAIYSIFNADFANAETRLKGGLPEGLLDDEVKDTTSRISWYGTMPKMLDTIVVSMEEEGFWPDVVVPLAHGAYRPGYMLGTVTGSNVIPIRLSTYKKGDTEPVLFDGEEEFIGDLVSGRNVVVFDEDSYEGKGANIVANLLRELGAGNVKTAVSFVGRPEAVDFCDPEEHYNGNGL